MRDFPGFSGPSYTQIPDAFFDELMAELSEAELRVLLYIMRRTFGFQKTADAISVTQLERGITTKAGEVLDHGTGMARSSIRRGCKGLVDKGILIVRRLQHEDGEFDTNVYALKFAEGVGAQSSYPGSGKLLPVGAQSSIQQTVIQKTGGQFEYSKDRDEISAKTRDVRKDLPQAG